MLRKTLYGLICFCAINSFAQDAAWVVPEDQSIKTSSFVFDEQTIIKGQELYKKNCQQCHGEPTKGNFAPLTPSPGDPASDKYQNQTDGALLYKISSGKGAMPAFKNIFSEEERWNIVSYLRSFNKKYVQPAIQQGRQKMMQAWAFMRFDSSSKKIFIKAKGVKGKDTIPVRFAAASLFAKRYFGDMKVGKSLQTDSAGAAVFVIPSDLPGNKEGELDFIVRINDENYFGDFQGQIRAPLGMKTDKPSLIAERAMWGKMDNAPWWLYIAFITVVGIVWGFIFYIIYGIIKIRKIGLKKEN